jgi:hypothetical protein
VTGRHADRTDEADSLIWLESARLTAASLIAELWPDSHEAASRSCSPGCVACRLYEFLREIAGAP